MVNDHSYIMMVGPPKLALALQKYQDFGIEHQVQSPVMPSNIKYTSVQLRNS